MYGPNTYTYHATSFHSVAPPSLPRPQLSTSIMKITALLLLGLALVACAHGDEQNDAMKKVVDAVDDVVEDAEDVDDGSVEEQAKKEASLLEVKNGARQGVLRGGLSLQDGESKKGQKGRTWKRGESMKELAADLQDIADRVAALEEDDDDADDTDANDDGSAEE